MGQLYAAIISVQGMNFYVALQSILESITTKDVFDILLTALIIGAFLWLFRKTKSTSIVVTAVISFILLYLVAYWLNLYTVLTIANAFLSGIVVILVIVFQKELRRFVEWINVAAVHRRFKRGGINSFDSAKSVISIIASTAFIMAKRKVGGLIVFPGMESIETFVSGGFDLDGKLSEPLLLSIFDTSSPGHDGAIIIEQDVIKKFGVVLPLSERDDYEKLKHLGTRHRSALGLSERTDALCVVISEEKGRVSLAFDGAIEVVESPAELEGKLKTFLNVAETNVSKAKLFSAQVLSAIKKHILDAFVAILLAIIFWLFISYPQLGIVQKELIAPVVFNNIPESATIDKLTAASVNVTLSGSEKDFQLLNESSIKAVIDMANNAISSKTQYLLINLKPENIQYPSSLKLLKISPNQVEFRITFNSPKP
jgi:uncharacterized protein (TIGR00159 family)